MSKHLLKCSKCGKKLIERQPNGLFHFQFGSYYKDKKKEDGTREPALNENGDIVPVVDIMIHGSIKIKCFKQGCQHINTFTFLPNDLSDF